MERNRDERVVLESSSWPYNFNTVCMGIALYYIDIALAISCKDEIKRKPSHSTLKRTYTVDLSNEWLIEHTSYKHVHIIDLYRHTSYINMYTLYRFM